MGKLGTILFCAAMAHGAEWGQTANGLRMSLAVDSQVSYFTLTFENIEERREMFLWLGTAGLAEADRVKMFLLMPDGTRAPLLFTGGNGVAPGRLIPMIAPLLGGSTYSLRIPINRLYRTNHTPIDGVLLRQGAFQAEIAQPPDVDMRFVDCFGLRIFWHGNAASNALRIR
ncbi:MAG: hypothetical protein JNK48_29195 [Bryobacterales bacterium]|nr:hypothetical protein [Bryobacterales bacterium]